MVQLSVNATTVSENDDAGVCLTFVPATEGASANSAVVTIQTVDGQAQSEILANNLKHIIPYMLALF